MTIECYKSACPKHSCNQLPTRDAGPLCYEEVCILANPPDEYPDAILRRMFEAWFSDTFPDRNFGYFEWVSYKAGFDAGRGK